MCVCIVNHYKDRHESELVPTTTTVVSLVLVLLCVVLIPVDIFSVSHESSASAHRLIRILYLVLYGLLALLAFVVIPFAYFYFEEYDEDVTVRKRVLGAAKYTAFLVVIVVVLLVIGLFVKTGKDTDLSGSPAQWYQEIKKSTNMVEGALGFVIGALTLVGFAIWLTYTAYGLSALPVGMIRGRRHVVEEASDVNVTLEETRKKQRVINAKYASGSKMSKKDEQQLNLLKQKERLYSQHSLRLEAKSGSRAGLLSKVSGALKPLNILFGVLFILLTLLLVVSFGMTQVDKLLHTKCGYRCGYTMTLPTLDNPFDRFLLLIAPFFPLDYIVLGCVVLYIFFSTLRGITSIGIRFLWVELFKVGPRSTPAQGLLLTAVFLMLAVLALNIELLTLAPRYVSFGTQKYVADNVTKWCDMNAPVGQCHMSQMAVLLNVITGVNQSFLGVIFYYGTWLFIVSWAVGAVIAFFKRKSANVSLSDEELDDEELDGSVPRLGGR